MENRRLSQRGSWRPDEQEPQFIIHYKDFSLCTEWDRKALGGRRRKGLCKEATFFDLAYNIYWMLWQKSTIARQRWKQGEHWGSYSRIQVAGDDDINTAQWQWKWEVVEFWICFKGKTNRIYLLFEWGKRAGCVSKRKGRTWKIFDLIEKKDRIAIYYNGEYWGKSRLVREAGNQPFSSRNVKCEMCIRYPSGNVS